MVVSTGSDQSQWQRVASELTLSCRRSGAGEIKPKRAAMLAYWSKAPALSRRVSLATMRCIMSMECACLRLLSSQIVMQRADLTIFESEALSRCVNRSNKASELVQSTVRLQDGGGGAPRSGDREEARHRFRRR